MFFFAPSSFRPVAAKKWKKTKDEGDQIHAF